ncbi:hypothetical protein CI610_00850 [invertebrate metagenome]|uniref:4Fe-4S ferredoxin-type domain-containing protein n=1 Tax=invertebrate metagenome TaxID=1711999 RepID=A0A2H9TAA9_9ZZZZ
MSRQKRPHKIYVRHVTGYFRQLRIISGGFLLLLFFSGVWLRIGGQPLILFDLPGRKFHLFGTIFWPQDFILLSFILIICACGLFTITALFGRIWCGYACPQSVFSGLFLWAERVTEGSRHRRIKQDQQPLTVPVFARKTAKHLIWLILSIATALTFVGYFVPVNRLLAQWVKLDIYQWSYLWVGFFTVATYLNAGWLREKICLHMCPYARFQSVMLDNQTLVVSYDEKRGEPRHKTNHRSRLIPIHQQPSGDCIDCTLCVQVCPTGIDIRKGLQYECLSCGACIDACNQVMKKRRRPENLIGYRHQDIQQDHKIQWFRPKVIGYGCVLLIMTGILITTLLTKKPLHAYLTHDPAVLYRVNDDGLITNTYQLKIINTYHEPIIAHIELPDSQRFTLKSPVSFTLQEGEVLEQPVVVAESFPQQLPAVTSVQFIIRTETLSKHPVNKDIKKESRFLSPVTDP